MIHWSHEGYYAGYLYCGRRRQPGDTAFHTPYGHDRVIAMMDNAGAEFCAECRREYEEARAEYLASPEYAEYLRREAAENAAFGR